MIAHAAVSANPMNKPIVQWVLEPIHHDKIMIHTTLNTAMKNSANQFILLLPLELCLFLPNVRCQHKEYSSGKEYLALY